MLADTDRENFPTQFQQASLDLVNCLLPLSSSSFYLVDPEMHLRGTVLRNLEADVERRYQDQYAKLDPLAPPRFAQSNELVVCLDEQLTEAEVLASTFYREFLRPMNRRHVADMFFRRDGYIIAVLTMLRSAELGPFQVAELDLLKKQQPFMEYTLNAVYQPARYRQRESVQSKYQLTDRELDVAELIVAGASNKAIVDELSVSLSTVKTHLQHIFHKAKVTSRNALTAQILGDISS